jgi:hypothetical protein
MLARSKYFRDFFQRAKDQGSDEPFETFIFHWLAMIIGFTELLSYQTFVPPKYSGDRELIEDFLNYCDFDAESKLAHVILEDELKDSRIFLAKRKGKSREENILDGSGKKGKVLAECWSGNISMTEMEQFKTFLFVACNVRNNLFHGKKSFMESSDVDLINHINQFLMAINEALSHEVH